MTENLLTAAEFKFAGDDSAAKGSFTGYASVFSNVDLGRDVVEPGAFSKSLREKSPGDIAMLWGHDMRGVPIGKWTHFEEDARGLKASGQLLMDIGKARDVYAAMHGGVVKGLSIGFMIPPGGSEMDRNGVRRIKSVDLLEVSVVTFPMNPRAKVSGIKAADGVKTIREFEDFLRDEGGFSNAQAKAIASRGFKGSADPRDEDGQANIAALQQLLAKIKS